MDDATCAAHQKGALQLCNAPVCYFGLGGYVPGVSNPGTDDVYKKGF
jgi:hypothetical protein